MIGKNTWFCMVLMLVFLPATLMAQEMMHGKWWLNKTMTDELQLTDVERQNLENSYTESRRRMIDLKGEVERQRFELDIILGKQDADKEAILAQYTKLEDARTELSKERFRLLIEVREIIGTERFQELKELYRDRAKDKMGRYPRGRWSSDKGEY